MNALPAPLTPPRCRAGSSLMPIDAAALHRLRTFVAADDAAFRAGVSLMAAAWRQTPTGSLPADEAALRHWAGLGHLCRRWRRVRDEALADFVLCSDGRLYHAALSRFAVESWIAERLKAGRRALHRGVPIGLICDDLSAGVAALERHGPRNAVALKARRWLERWGEFAFDVPSAPLQPGSDLTQ